MYERVLVPLDGSRVAELALNQAAQLARQFGSELLLVRVVSPSETAVEGLDDEQEEIGIDVAGTSANTSTAGDYLSNLVGSLKADGLKAKATVVQGEIADKLLETAEAANAQLIVMSTHGHGGFKRSGAGSVAVAVVSRSRIPLLVLPYR